MNAQTLAVSLSQAEIPYAIIDQDETFISILIAEKSRESFKALAAESKWKKIKDKSKDLYLYGMKHFLNYSMNGIKLHVCCQLACRSTLNNGWIPLDRKINDHLFEHIRSINSVCYLGVEDELCYLTAKCVYTEKEFHPADIERIKGCMIAADRTQLVPKLEGIFFHFTDILLQLLTEQRYSDIVASLWRFAAY